VINRVNLYSMKYFILPTLLVLTIFLSVVTLYASGERTHINSIDSVKQKILKKANKLLEELNKIPEVRNLLKKYNLGSVKGRKLFVEDVKARNDNEYEVTLRVAFTPTLSMMLRVIVDKDVNLIGLASKPRISTIPNKVMDKEIDEILKRGKRILETHVKELVQHSMVLKELKKRSIDPQDAIDYILQEVFKIGGFGVVFNTTSGKFYSYIVPLVFVKVRIDNKEQWIPGHIHASKFRDSKEVESLKLLTINIYFDFIDGKIVVKKVEVYELPYFQFSSLKR